MLTNAMYDNWWNGGNRTTPQRHNMVGVLTEAASVKLATPIFLGKGDLGGATRGFNDHRPAVNFVDPWPGGWWRLRDVVDYELIAARSVLTLAARYRWQFQANYRAMAADAIGRGRAEPPSAWIVPTDQRDLATAAKMVGILRETGVEVDRARAPFEAGGVTYPAGSWVLKADQPYRAHLKDMMERQSYPPRFGADGAAEPPYDVAGWTLPLQMGVRSVEAGRPFRADLEPMDAIEPPAGTIVGPEPATTFLFDLKTNDDYLVYNALLERKIPFQRLSEGADPVAAEPFRGRYAVGATPVSREFLRRKLRRASARVEARRDPIPEGVGRREVARRRVGLYQPWVPSMDEGWTRLVLERFGFPYETIHNADVRAGRLADRFEVILIPSIPTGVLRDGFARDATEPAYVGGLGNEGAAALREFIGAGGTVVGLEDSCPFLIQELNLPVRNVLAGLKTSEFYGPGSIVRGVVPEAARLYRDDPHEVSLYFDRSLAFEPPRDAMPRHEILVEYAPSDPLESGWLLGPEKIRGKAAAVSVRVGPLGGRVVLFGFPPQHRGQTHGTFRLLFESLTRP